MAQIKITYAGRLMLERAKAENPFPGYGYLLACLTDGAMHSSETIRTKILIPDWDDALLFLLKKRAVETIGRFDYTETCSHRTSPKTEDSLNFCFVCRQWK